MSLLYLITNLKRYLFICMALPFCTVVPAVDNAPDSTFEVYCKTSDAYLLYSYTDVTYFPALWNNYRRQTSVQSKIVVNNRTGVEKFAFVNLSKLMYDHLKMIRVETLKSDGTVIKLDSSLIFNHQSDGKHSKDINYPIPGVEPGDTIEISYVYTENLEDFELRDFVSLYHPVPSINTEFTIRTRPDRKVIFKTYNGFPNPSVISNDTIIYCVFKMENVKGLKENQYTCEACELPYVYYSVDKKKDEIRTWKEVYNQEFNIITQPFKLDYEKSSYYKKWKKTVIGEAEDSSKFYKLNLLLTDIYNNIRIEPLKEEELIKSNGYFLKERRFDPISIRRLYRQILEDLEIDYWAVFGRSKRSGNIDPYFIRKGEYDHIFFAFNNAQGNLNLLYPPDESFMYQVDEIPTSLYNTEAIMAKPYLTKKISRGDKFINVDFKMAEVDSVIVEMIKIPGLGANRNYLRQIFYCDVDVSNKNVSYLSNFSVSGGLSTDLRSFFSLLNKNAEMNEFYDALSEFEDNETALKIDTVIKIDLKNFKPFIFNINAQGTLKKGLSFINDSIVSLTLDNIIQHSQIESDEDSTGLNYYLDYSYSDIFMLILKFPCDIELLNVDRNKREIINSYGAYLFHVNLVNNNQLIIQSSYEISKDVIPKADYLQLQDLNGLVKEVKNTRLLIKLKEPKATSAKNG